MSKKLAIDTLSQMIVDAWRRDSGSEPYFDPDGDTVPLCATDKVGHWLPKEREGYEDVAEQMSRNLSVEATHDGLIFLCKYWMLPTELIFRDTDLYLLTSCDEYEWSEMNKRVAEHIESVRGSELDNTIPIATFGNGLTALVSPDGRVLIAGVGESPSIEMSTLDSFLAEVQVRGRA